MKQIIYFIFVILLLFSCTQDTEKKDIHKEDTKDFLFTNPSYRITNFGEYVLSMSKTNYDSLHKKGFSSENIFVYYPRKYISKTDDFFVIEEFNDTIKIPSSLVIPLPDSQKVKKGDIVLTWWQKGTGMQRALVLNDKPSCTPTVYYLDNQYYFYYSNNDPLFWVDTLAPNTFMKIEDKIMSGRSFSVKGEYLTSFYVIINFMGPKILGLSWAGDLKLINSKNCKIVPINIEFEIGDSVFVPYLGTYVNGIVKNIFADIGQMKVTIDYFDSEKVIKTSIIDSYKIEN